MYRISGIKGVLPLECINPRKDKWHLRWDITDGENGSCSYMETLFLHKPTLEEIRQTITEWHNKQTDEVILSGFRWRGAIVWLSPANQLNYKIAYDKAVETRGASLPVAFKFGTDSEPSYYTFGDLGDLREFYEGYTSHIQSAIAEGWQRKDNIDLSIYQD